MGKKADEQKRKRKLPQRFGRQATLSDSDDDLDSVVDSLSNDGDFTPTKKGRYDNNMILSDDDDIDESRSRLQNSVEQRNFDADLDSIDMTERSNESTSNSITIIGEKNRQGSGQIDHILQNVQQSLTVITNSICKLNEKIDQIFARVD